MVGHLEKLRVVKQCHVDTTTVRRVVMNNLVVAVGNLRLCHEVFEHHAVLNLRNAQHPQAFFGVNLVVGVGAYRRDGVCHIMQLGGIFLRVPSIFALRQKLFVVFDRVVDRIVKILKVIKTHEADFELLLGSHRGDDEKHHDCQKI